MKTAAAILAAAFLAGPATDPVKVDFATLSDFEYEEGMKLPDMVTVYDQKRVTITGFMRREVAGSGPEEFFLLINDACGCEGTPMMNEIVCCAMPPGEKTEILPGVVGITGKLYVGEQKQDGVVLAIYCLDVEKIIP